MHKLNLLLAGAVLLGCSTAPAGQAQIQDPDRWGVSTHCYEFHPETDTPAPSGYKLVYLSHYGRHGSRTGMKVGDTYDRVLAVLEEAEAQQLLTAQGDSLLREVRQVNSCFDGMEGRLTRIGEAEQHELARRIYKRYKPVFRKGSKQIRVELSTVPRSIVSGMCFVQTLTSLQPDLNFSIDTGEKYFAYINNSAPKAVTVRVKAIRDSLNALNVSDGKEFCERVFSDPEKGLQLIGEPDEFQKMVWDCAREGKASGVQADMFRHLPESVVRKWWADAIRALYLRQCNSVEFGDERMVNAQPLVEVMLTQAQEALAGGAVAADLKFGHDHPLIATASWFGLEGVGDRLSLDDLPDAWADPMNIPFAANMQMAFYRNRAGNVLVKFVYNGRERKLRELSPVSGPYYNWTDVLARFLPERKQIWCGSDWYGLESGEKLSFSDARKSPGIYGTLQTKLWDSSQSISFVRFCPETYSLSVLSAEAELADSTSALCSKAGAIAGINGSYFDVKELTNVTYIKDDGVPTGEFYSRQSFRTNGALFIGKDKLAIDPIDTTAAWNGGENWWEVMASGPVLVDEGVAAEYPEGGKRWNKFYGRRHPRSIVGMDAEGFVWLIVVDGRFPGEGEGMTVAELTKLSGMIGLTDALNLDGGGSSTLWTQSGGVLNHPYDNRRYDNAGQRIVPNVLVVKK